MSAIASFYVVPAGRLTEIMAAATPTPARLLRPARDNFPAILRDAGRALEAFGWSGWAFNTLDLYLEARHGLNYERFGDAIASQQLSKARGSEWLIVTASSAAELLTALDGIKVETDDVRAFVVSEHGADGAMEETQALQAALTALKAWLAEVSAGSVGLLSIG